MPSDIPPDLTAPAPRSTQDLGPYSDAFDEESVEHPIPPDSLRPYDLNTELKNSLMPPLPRWSERASGQLLRQIAAGFVIALAGFAGGKYAPSPTHAATAPACVQVVPREVVKAPSRPEAPVAAERKPVAVPAELTVQPVAGQESETTPRTLHRETKAAASTQLPVPTPSVAKAEKMAPPEGSVRRKKNAGPAPSTAELSALARVPTTPGYKPPTASF